MNLSPERVLPVLGRRAVKARTLSSADTTGLYSVYCVLMTLLIRVTCVLRGTDMNTTALLHCSKARSAIAMAFLSALFESSLNFVKDAIAFCRFSARRYR